MLLVLLRHWDEIAWDGSRIVVSVAVSKWIHTAMHGTGYVEKMFFQVGFFSRQCG